MGWNFDRWDQKSCDEFLWSNEIVEEGCNPNCKECYDESGIDGPQDFVKACEDGTANGQQEFSTHECDICGSNLAGSRYTVHFKESFDEEGPGEHYSDVCPDCVHYIHFGEVPNGEG